MRMQKGSLTAFNEREMETYSDTGKIANVVKTVASPERWWAGMHDIVGKCQLGQNMRGLATIMTDPRSGRLLSQLIQMKPNSGQARAIAARLIMQANSASKGPGSWSNEPSNEVNQRRQ